MPATPASNDIDPVEPSGVAPASMLIFPLLKPEPEANWILPLSSLESVSIRIAPLLERELVPDLRIRFPPVPINDRPVINWMFPPIPRLPEPAPAVPLMSPPCPPIESPV